MASVAGALPAFAVSLGPSGGGAVTYRLGAGAAWRLQALSFTVDLSGSATADDVFVRLLTQNGVLIAGQVPGSSQAAGSAVAYALAQDLNPCDAITSSFLNLSPDTFAPITLVDGCQIVIEARVATTGTLDASATITDAQAWVETLDAGGTLESVGPLLVPTALV